MVQLSIGIGIASGITSDFRKNGNPIAMPIPLAIARSRQVGSANSHMTISLADPTADEQ